MYSKNKLIVANLLLLQKYSDLTGESVNIQKYQMIFTTYSKKELIEYNSHLLQKINYIKFSGYEKVC